MFILFVCNAIEIRKFNYLINNSFFFIAHNVNKKKERDIFYVMNNEHI